MNIKVISEKNIKPSSPTPKHLRFLRASLIDQTNSPVLTPLVFFYCSQKLTTKIDTRDILDRLHGSLPKTLSIFYPLGGRVLDANYIECNDEGVPYIEAEVEKPLKLKDVILKANPTQLDKLVPPYGKGEYTKLMLAIQVTIFSCGGLSIGVKINHAISDGFSLLMFVKTWASIARDSNKITPNLCRPCFDTWKLFPPLPQQKLQDRDVDASHNPDFIKEVPVTNLFLFSESNLLALRSKLFSCNSTSNAINKGKTFKPSIAMVLSAFILSRIKVACHSFNIQENIPHEVFQAVDLRPKVALPDEQSYYFGNMVVLPTAKLPMKINDDNEIKWLCKMIGKLYESIGKVRNDGMFIRDTQLSKEYYRFILDKFERKAKGTIELFGLSNLTSLPVVYEADFGWGKPIWVTNPSQIYKNFICLIPAGPSSKDIVACISLMGEDMAKLESDTKFKAFVGKAFHAGSKL